MTPSPGRTAPVIALAISGTALGLGGTDLVLPSVPRLPEALGGSPGAAQLVLTAYVAGTVVGLLGWGALSARGGARRFLPLGLGCLAVTSVACAAAPTVHGLAVARLLQGAASAAPAVFAPGLIRALLPPPRALRTFSLLASVESIVPAAAPIAGAGLIVGFGWRAPLVALAVAALAVWALVCVVRSSLPAAAPRVSGGGYGAALRLPPFRRLAAGQALTLGGLLTFVLGAPVTIVDDLGGTTGDFVVMQVVSVAGFVVAANVSPRLADRWGPGPLVVGGTFVAAVGGAALIAFDLLAGSPSWLAIAAAPVSVGLGLRGPVGFNAALDAAPDDDRASALILVATSLTAVAGSGVFALAVDVGLLALALVTCAVLSAALVLALRSAQSGDLRRVPAAG